MNGLKWAAFILLALFYIDVCLTLVVYGWRKTSLIALLALLLGVAFIIVFVIVKC